MSRLDDLELAALEASAVAGKYGDDFALILDALSELKERRQRDLTSGNDIEALRWLRGEMQQEVDHEKEALAWLAWANRSIAVLDKLLAGSKP